MHDEQVDIEVDDVRRLLRAQLPSIADLPIELVPTDGTDHAIFRVGTELSARLPLIGWAADQAAMEAEWLPRLAPLLPVRLHEPVLLGEPDDAYPYQWCVYRWLDGAAAHPSRIADPLAFAEQAAELVLALRSIRLPGVPRSIRGMPLRRSDADIRGAIAQLRAELGDADTDVLLDAWSDATSAPKWSGEWVVAHGDLTSGNLLVDAAGALSGLIDWSCWGLAEPANDLELAWDVFDGPARARFRSLVDVDDDTWTRGRGWAVKAAYGIPYYRATNPGIVERAWRRLRNVIDDVRATS
jgi:aminoglycoside phosphotransferase (APT) family kinase protein